MRAESSLSRAYDLRGRRAAIGLADPLNARSKPF